MDAAHYQGTMEHFRLSQDLSSETTPSDVTAALTAAVAVGTHSRLGHRHSIVSELNISNCEAEKNFLFSKHIFCGSLFL